MKFVVRTFCKALHDMRTLYKGYRNIGTHIPSNTANSIYIHAVSTIYSAAFLYTFYSIYQLPGVIAIICY